MFVSECLDVNEKGHLTIGGCDTTELAKRFGTPLYVMDEQTIRKNCRAFTDTIKTHYNGRGHVAYASKAFNCLEICRIMAQEGMCLDVCSTGEYYTALKAGFPAKDCYYHGNCKTEEDLYFAMETGIGNIIVDNIEELLKIEKLSEQLNYCPKIFIRVKPGVDAHTHDFIRTGQIDSKFGFALENGEAIKAVKFASECKHINFFGLHCHIGSQIFDVEPFEHTAEIMLEFIKKIKDEFGIVIKELDLGGGFGIKYTEGDNPKHLGDYIVSVARVMKEKSAELDIELPEISIEPGRSIVGDAGITLYTVGAVKDIERVRRYVLIDGGMADNPRYALYQAKYTIVNAEKADAPADDTITLAGRCCESGDLIGEDMKVKELHEGDVVAVLSTGAYNYSMASNYNRFSRPAVITVNEGQPKVIIRRESIQDIILNDI